jgi:multidrug efflux pump subunit AcrB
MSAGAPIYIELRSPDVARLQLAAESLKEKIATYPGLYDIADSWQGGKQEVKLDILPTAEPLGLTLDDLATQVRQAFYGAEAQRIQRGRDDIRVMVRYPESERRSLGDLEEMRVRTPSGSEVPFYAVAQADRGQGFSTIRRADRQRVISVTSNLDPERANANQIVRELERTFLPGLLNSHPGLAYALEGEQREQQKTMQGLMQNYAFAMILIYILLAIPLRSYFQPLIIMAVIPFGLIGAIFGHVLLGIGFSMMSVFGVVALSGVVVNSSLVLVHYINTRRNRGLPLHEAVREAGVSRFRPIVLTSVTTFAGLAPLLLEQSMGAQFLIPMAASLGFGVIFATTISLFLVPCSYVILDDLISGARRLLGRPTGSDVSTPATSGASSASSAA